MLCCESSFEERSAGNPHATFCGSRTRVTASGDPVWGCDSPGLLTKYFAHANSAKCCMNNPQRKKASAVLFRNCQRYLRGELAILKPDIIVTQGNEAKSAICTMKDQTVQSLDEFASVISFIGKKTFWLHTYHPANWSAFNKQRNQNKATREAEGWLKYAKHISDFVTEQA